MKISTQKSTGALWFDSSSAKNINHKHQCSYQMHEHLWKESRSLLTFPIPSSTEEVLATKLVGEEK